MWREGLCPTLVRPNWTVPVGHLAGRHTAVVHWIFGHEDKWRRHRVGEHEVEPYPLTVYKLHLFVAWSPTEFVYLERSQQGSHQVGLSVDGGCRLGVVDGSFGLGVGVARRRA